MTKNGSFPLDEEHEEIWVNEEEIRSAVSHVSHLADMIRRAKTVAKRLHKKVDERMSLDEEMLKKKVGSWKKMKLPRIVQVGGLFRMNAMRVT